jgi:hypothetical protein
MQDELDQTPESAFKVEVNAEGFVEVTMPRDVFFAGESLPGDNTVRLFLNEKQAKELSRAQSDYFLTTVVEAAEKAVRNLPKDSVRRDLGRAGIKLLRRFHEGFTDRAKMAEHLGHAQEVFDKHVPKS